MSVEVEAVVDGGKSRLGGKIGEALIHQLLYSTVQMDVFNRAAANAYQMVVVPQQRFGQLEVSVITPGVDSSDNATANQHIEVAVGRALGEVWVGRHDVRKRHRLPSLGQHFHKLPSAGGIAMLLPSQSGPDLQVKFCHMVVVARHGERFSSHLRSVFHQVLANDTHSQIL